MFANELATLVRANTDKYYGTKWKVIKGPLFMDCTGELHGEVVVHKSGQLTTTNTLSVYIAFDTEVVQLNNWKSSTFAGAVEFFSQGKGSIKLVRYDDDPVAKEVVDEIIFENSFDANNECLSLYDVYNGNWYVKGD